jgi:esterase/lipase superfamily enzyme
MLFITNRHLNEGKESVEDRSVTFNMEDNEPAVSVFFCERKGNGKYVELMSARFFEKLRRMKCKQILLYIHGFNNFPEGKNQIFERAEAMQNMISIRDNIIVIPMIWPCDNDLGIILDYWDDQKSAEASSAGFARVLGLFLKWRDKQDDACTVRINMLAHSMGNRVLRYTLASWANDFGSVPLIFRNVFLAAADIANESLEPDEEGGQIAESARNVVVYHASDDLALRSSKVTNLKNKVVSRRLGHSGPEDMKKVRDNVYSVDCDDFNNTYDKPMGHSYFLTDPKGKDGVVFKHMLDAITTGRVQADSGNRLILDKTSLQKKKKLKEKLKAKPGENPKNKYGDFFNYGGITGKFTSSSFLASHRIFLWNPGFEERKDHGRESTHHTYPGM